MGWARFDDNYTHHPKVRDAGAMAELLDMRAIIWCCRYNTDGLVSRGDIENIKHGIPKVYEKVDRLVAVGRWKTNPNGGWFIHDFLEFNPSKAQREAQREAGKERQRQWRARNGVTNASRPQGDGSGIASQAIATCEKCGGLSPCHCGEPSNVVQMPGREVVG